MTTKRRDRAISSSIRPSPSNDHLYAINGPMG
ncbi:hypothetical protein J2Y48_001378 [Mycoplana sp. BE70]|nr:hypothetical protein [Mycoplana sp. BE70]